MSKPLSSLNLFPTYGSREEYTAKTGKPCPEWDGTKHPKIWEDPNAKKVFMVAGTQYTLYANTFVKYDEVLHQPVWDQLGIPVDEAKTVNIPPKGTGQTNVPGADQPEIPCPMRLLADDEIIKPVFGGIPMVFTASELQSVEVGFSQDDRERLKRIAAKLGV